MPIASCQHRTGHLWPCVIDLDHLASSAIMYSARFKYVRYFSMLTFLSMFVWPFSFACCSRQSHNTLPKPEAQYVRLLLFFLRGFNIFTVGQGQLALHVVPFFSRKAALTSLQYVAVAELLSHFWFPQASYPGTSRMFETRDRSLCHFSRTCSEECHVGESPFLLPGQAVGGVALFHSCAQMTPSPEQDVSEALGSFGIPRDGFAPVLKTTWRTWRRWFWQHRSCCDHSEGRLPFPCRQNETAECHSLQSLSEVHWSALSSPHRLSAVPLSLSTFIRFIYFHSLVLWDRWPKSDCELCRTAPPSSSWPKSLPCSVRAPTSERSPAFRKLAENQAEHPSEFCLSWQGEALFQRCSQLCLSISWRSRIWG